MDKQELARDTQMSGELLAWLDEKTWTDEDKVLVLAASLPVLMVDLAKDKETFDKLKKYFLSMIDSTCDPIWKAKRGP